MRRTRGFLRAMLRLVLFLDGLTLLLLLTLALIYF